MKLLKKRRLVIVVLLFAGIAAVCLLISDGTKKSTIAGSYRGFNVILVTIDTLRADHLPLYGYQGVRTPYLDQLGAESIVFNDVLSHVPLTLPSHVNILTGLLPPSAGVRDNSGFFLKPEVQTLAEILLQNGYETGAFVSAFVLDSVWQIDQGFETYFDDFSGNANAERRAEDTVWKVLPWLQAKRSNPFFCWIHLYDPHDPYDPPEPYRSEYATSLYDGEIAYADNAFGSIMAILRESGLLEKTIIVVTSDHGESFGEHGEYGHSLFLYNATQHVPLVLFLPGQKGRRIGSTVGLVDIPPTLLDLVGIKTEPEMQGESLIPQLNGEREITAPVYSESFYGQVHFGWSPLRSLTTSRYRYIDAPRRELYDRRKDPEDSHNLAGEESEVVEKFHEELRSYRGESSVSPQAMDPEMEEKLRSLGYLSGSTEQERMVSGADPKDKIAVYRRHQEALVAVKERKFQQAVSLLEPLLREEAAVTDVYLTAGIAYSALGKYTEAVDCYLAAISFRPRYSAAISNLAAAYEKLGDMDQALVWYTKLLEDPGKRGVALMHLANIYRKKGQNDEANRWFEEASLWFERALKETSEPLARSHTYVLLAELYLQSGKLDLAESTLKKAIELTPEQELLHFNLGLLYEQSDQINAAISEFEKEIGISPSFGEAYLRLGLLYRQIGRREAALLCFRKALELRPGDPVVENLLSETSGPSPSY